MTRWTSPWNGRATLLAADDVDTDQIIPARFLKATTRDGLGAHLFADWRNQADGTPKSDFPLNRPGAASRPILVAGRNFGCGSSREHAPWALTDFGISAIVAKSFGDIFRSNALKNGLLPIAIDGDDWAALAQTLEQAPETEFTVDLPARQLRIGTWSTTFPIDPFARFCLIEGVDELGFLLQQEAAIQAFEEQHV